MKRRSRIVMIVALLTILALGMETAMASAASLSQIQKNIKSKQQELNKSKAQEKSLADQVINLDQQISQKEDNIAELESAISEAEAHLVVLETELKAAEEKVDEQNKNLNARLRNMYKNGTVGFIDVLMDSGSFSEFLNNLSLVEKVYTSDKDVLAELQKIYDEIDAKKKEIESAKQELASAKATAEEEKESLQADKSSVEKKKAAIAADSAETQKELERLEADARALTSTINKGSSSGTKYTGGVMVWPAPQYTRISSEFGGRTHPVSGKYKYHSGMDLAAPGGSPILAAASGKVIIAGNTGNGYGNYVVIDHGGGITTLYGHCSKLLVKKGQSVSRGQQIAKVGSTGLSTGNHLHFEVRVKGACVNPKKYIT